jgi:hypothetical protein
MNKSRALWAMVFFLSVDAVLFRLPVYCQFVKPNSHAGALVQRVQLAKEKEKENAPLVAVVGDSRMREGFSAKIFDELAADSSKPDRALQLAASGSTLRVWNYLLEDVDPDRNAFKMIVIGLPSFFDDDYSSMLVNNKLDLQMALPVLKTEDTLDFVKTFDGDARGEMLLGAVLRLYGYRRDVKDFIMHAPDRLAELKDSAIYWKKSDYLYEGDRNSMAGIKINDQKQLVNVPPYLEQAKVDRLRCAVFPEPVEPDSLKRNYLEYWLNRLAERYAGSPTKIVLICIPNHPLPAQDPPPHISRTIVSLTKYPNVRVLPEDAFASLNQPEYFSDDIHLNVTGRREFTKMLSDKLLDPSLLATRTALNHTTAD